MNREGHLGVALAVYSPIGFVTVQGGFLDLAFLGAGLAVVLASLPDIDLKVPFVAHRGYTHTVWFAAIVGILCGAVGARLLVSTSLPSTIERAAFWAAVGTSTICSHVAADALTPMGVKPFAPFGRRRTIKLVRSSNRVANRLVLVTGIGIFAWVLWIAVQS